MTCKKRVEDKPVVMSLRILPGERARLRAACAASGQTQTELLLAGMRLQLQRLSTEETKTPAGAELAGV